MHETTLENYWASEKWQQIGKSAFSAFQQQISGCKFLLRRLIALPLLDEGAGVGQLGAVQDPQILLQLTREWTDHRKSDKHRNAVENSKPRREQERLSNRLHQAETLYKKAPSYRRWCLTTLSTWST